MTILKKILLLAVIGCFVIAPSVVKAQVNHNTASNMALGSGGAAYLDSYHANFVNPANLMLNAGVKPRFSLGILGGLSTTAGGSLLNVGVYNDYFTSGNTISGQIASDALDQWFGTGPGNMRNMGLNFDFVPLGAAYRSDKWAASLALRSRILMNGATSRGFAELGIYGLDSDIFSAPRPVNFSVESLAFHEISAGYSRELLTLPNLLGFAKNVKIYAGIAPKLLLGAQSTRLNFNSTLLMEGESANEIDLIRHDFDYQLETTGSLSNQLTRFYNDRQASNEIPDINDYVDPQGEDFYGINASGWGFDLGGTAEMNIDVPFLGEFFRGQEKLRVGLSLTDIGQVVFKDDVARFSADDVLEWEGFEFDQEKLDEEFDGDRGDYMESVLKDSIAAEVYGSFSPADIEKISRPLPARINFGGQLVMNRLSLALDLGKGFVDRGISSNRISLSTGVEYRLFGFLPFRIGIRTGGETSTSYSAGFGVELRNFEFSLAAASVANSSRRGTSAGVAWSGLVIRF